MKLFFKINSSILATCLMILTLFGSSCKQNKTNSEKVIGSWKLSVEDNEPSTKDSRISFFKDGTIIGKEDGKAVTNKLTYKFIHDEKYLQIYEDGKLRSELEIQELTDKKLKLYWAVKGTSEYTKISEQ